MSNTGIHHIKCDPEHFALVQSHKLGIHICPNDGDFRAGDALVLQEYDSKRAIEREAAGYTGKTIEGVIKYVATSAQYPLFLTVGVVVLEVVWHKGLNPVLR
jgi:hypothetical protein